MPMSPDELMDTGDYELYNPRVQGLRGRDATPMIRSLERLNLHPIIFVKVMLRANPI